MNILVCFFNITMELDALDILGIALIVLSIGAITMVVIKEIKTAKMRTQMMYGKKRKRQKKTT
ncbi:hypothetical protein [Adhaeribacter aquaticus]|uniref:hypothetical protein n=1 Tax=Adhaeribacter aquaticus TaxID=299567 RepID=UPI00047DBE91|nr:hypothetical protein [Adhaeribacter aquaticus]